MTDADGRQTDAGAARDAEDNGEHDSQTQAGGALSVREQVGGEPEGKAREETEDERGDHGVETAETVSHEAGTETAETGGGVDDGNELICEGCVDCAGAEGVLRQVGKGGEETPFDEEDADGGQEDVASLGEEDARRGEHGTPVGPSFGAGEVGGVGVVGCGGFGAVDGGEARARECDTDATKSEDQKPQDTGCPGPADFREERFEEKGEDDAPE